MPRVRTADPPPNGDGGGGGVSRAWPWGRPQDGGGAEGVLGLIRPGEASVLQTGWFKANKDKYALPEHPLLIL